MHPWRSRLLIDTFQSGPDKLPRFPDKIFLPGGFVLLLFAPVASVAVTFLRSICRNFPPSSPQIGHRPPAHSSLPFHGDLSSPYPLLQRPTYISIRWTPPLFSVLAAPPPAPTDAQHWSRPNQNREDACFPWHGRPPRRRPHLHPVHPSLFGATSTVPATPGLFSTISATAATSGMFGAARPGPAQASSLAPPLVPFLHPCVCVSSGASFLPSRQQVT
jgi:hypothetical protein